MIPQLQARRVLRGEWCRLCASQGNEGVGLRVRSHRPPSEAALTRANNPAPNPAQSDVRGVLRAELQDIDRLAQQALSKADDAMTRIHLRDLRTEIKRILEP